MQLLKASFLPRRSANLVLLGVAYASVGTLSWLLFRTLTAPVMPAVDLRDDEAEVGGPPGAFHDSWRNDHSHTCRFEITWREDEIHTGLRAADLTVTNISGTTLWYHEWNRALECRPFVPRDRSNEVVWERSEDPLVDCGRGMVGDSWRSFDDGAQVNLSATWINDRSDVEICFVASFWQELKDGWIPRRPVDACSPVFRIGE